MLNQNEEEIDCGGVCALKENGGRACVIAPFLMSVVWQRSFLLTLPNDEETIYALGAMIQNQNKNIAAQKVPYTFTAVDEKGNILAEVRGVVNIQPSGFTPVFVRAVDTKRKKIAQTIFALDDARNYYQEVQEPPQVRFSQYVLDVEGENPNAEVTVHNESTKNIFDMSVLIVVYDSEGSAVSMSRTLVDTLSPSASKKLYFTWPNKIQSNKKPLCDALVDQFTPELCYYPITHFEAYDIYQ